MDKNLKCTLLRPIDVLRIKTTHTPNSRGKESVNEGPSSPPVPYPKIKEITAVIDEVDQLVETFKLK